ncbi:MAG: YciI family protein [Defluviicoccus sp.]|nr:YciI family protein [Defluviicoccus sp.]MDE0384333.1 YciI family protein [Defluviicoccus sp.]
MADHHDMLGKTFFAILTEAAPGTTRERLGATLPAHLDHQVRLEQEGILFAAGPLDAEDGSRRGLIVIRAESFEEARRIADTDPFHAQGLRTYTVERWTVNEGSYTVRLTYSDQRLALD